MQERIEQLQEANEQLRAQLMSAEQQLLAAATPLISFGEDTLRRILSYVERGMRVPGLDAFLRITLALGIDSSEVLREAMVTVNRRP